MLYGILLGIDVLVAIALIVLVLLHRGKGAEAGAVFSGGGGGGSSSVFGAHGPQAFLTRMVAVLAAAFLINSLALAYLANRDFSTRSVLDEVEHEAGLQSTSTETVEGSAEDDLPTDGMDDAASEATEPPVDDDYDYADDDADDYRGDRP